MVTQELVCVYALQDPATGETRYVGATRYPEARARSHRLGWDRVTRSWVAGLHEEPVFKTLEWAPLRWAASAESRWLRHYSKVGRLINRKIKKGGFPNCEPNTRSLRRVAKNAGHTLKSLAFVVGCSAQHLSRAARGLCRVSGEFKEAVRIATVSRKCQTGFLWWDRFHLD